MDRYKKFLEFINTPLVRTFYLRLATAYVGLILAYVQFASVFLNKSFDEYIIGITVNIFLALIGSNVAVAVPTVIKTVTDNRKKKKEETTEPPIENKPKPDPTPEPDPKSSTKKGRNIMGELAQTMIGIKEIPGEESNSVITGWFTELGWDRAYGMTNDDIPWCSSFPNIISLRLGLPRSNSPRAKSWLRVGKKISWNEVRRLIENGHSKDFGIVAVYHRQYINNDPFSGPGHVNIVTEVNGDTFVTIGGNESNQTKRAVNSKDDKMLIGFRLLER